MKKNKINLILILLGLFFFSCGKDKNTVAHPDQQLVPGLPKPKGPCPAMPESKEDLLTALDDADSFPQELFGFGGTYSFQHDECTISESSWSYSRTCGTFGVPLRTSSRGRETIDHELASTKTALLDVFSTAAENSDDHEVYYQGAVHQITAGSSHKHPIWIINFCYPLVANPVRKINKK